MPRQRFAIGLMFEVVVPGSHARILGGGGGRYPGESIK